MMNNSELIRNQNAIEANNISRNYSFGENQATGLKESSLKVKQGDVVALSGPSGSGKTTLLNLLGCIDRPSSGELYCLGQNILNLSDSEVSHFRAEKLGFVFQTFNLFPVLSAGENVEYPLYKMNYSQKERQNLSQKALDEVGLNDLYHRRPNELSGGQRQRVALARAIVHKPKLIIADEPTASLDETTSRHVGEILIRLSKEHNITLVVASHDPIILNMVQRNVVLNFGNIIDDRINL